MKSYHFLGSFFRYEEAAVTYEGKIEMPGDLKKPKPRKGGGGGAPPVRKVSVQDMITKIRETFHISDEEALYIREVSEEKLKDQSILQTIAANKTDIIFLENIFKGEVNLGIQDAYAVHNLYEQLFDSRYTDKVAIFDIMAFTVIRKGLELAEAA
uniref:Type I restriction enzyme, R subunit n=1 Tax=Candidatus Kentrum sp. FW TaxID=2126338 RepID=A0A450SFB5_9GAMM|nr:MAG: type I restriction enzyme, R subunit [Candidatus Kentron sp. FW]